MDTKNRIRRGFERMVLTLASMAIVQPLLSQNHDDYCFFAVMMDNSGSLPGDLHTAPAALLVSVIDYTNIYLPVAWEKQLARDFLRQAGDLGIDFKVAASAISLNKARGDEDLAKQLRDKGVKNVMIYTVIYQRTPARIKTGHTITVAPFTDDASIVDMAGKGHSYVGKSLSGALRDMRNDYKHKGVITQPEFGSLSEKSRVQKVFEGLPDLSGARLFIHGYFGACIPTHPPISEQWKDYYEGLANNNERMVENWMQLAELLSRYQLELNTVFLTQDLSEALGDKDYLIVPIDDRLEDIRDRFIGIEGKGFMENVPHDMENPYYLFALFQPSTGHLYVPGISSRGSGTYFDSLEDVLQEISKKR